MSYSTLLVLLRKHKENACNAMNMRIMRLFILKKKVSEKK